MWSSFENLRFKGQGHCMTKSGQNYSFGVTTPFKYKEKELLSIQNIYYGSVKHAWELEVQRSKTKNRENFSFASITPFRCTRCQWKRLTGAELSISENFMSKVTTWLNMSKIAGFGTITVVGRTFCQSKRLIWAELSRPNMDESEGLEPLHAHYKGGFWRPVCDILGQHS